mgnify:CR=1
MYYTQLLPTRRRKDSDTENDRENGLRMNNEMTMKEKRFSFLPIRKEEKRKAYPHLAHCLLPGTNQRFAKVKEPNLSYTQQFYLYRKN